MVTLISRGHRVAICDQTSTVPIKGNDGKRFIQREVTRIVTAGTFIEPTLLDHKSNNYLCAIISDGHRTGIAHVDITTGDFAVTEVENADAVPGLQRLSPAEVIPNSETEFSNQNLPTYLTRLHSKFFKLEVAKKTLLKHFNNKSLQPFGLKKVPLAIQAAVALISYLKETQTDAAEQLTRLKSYDSRDFMLIDAHTLRSLEVLESSTNSSLLLVIDRTRANVSFWYWSITIEENSLK